MYVNPNITNLIIQLFNKHLFRDYYVPGTILDQWSLTGGKKLTTSGNIFDSYDLRYRWRYYWHLMDVEARDAAEYLVTTRRKHPLPLPKKDYPSSLKYQ